MHRYILFAGNSDIPNGGIDDYVGSRSTVNALKKLALVCHVGGNGDFPAWAHIVDVTTMGRLWSLDGDEWIDNNDEPANRNTRT